MHWPELVFASIAAALAVLFHFLPIEWSDATQVKFIAGAFIVCTAMLYLWFVDDERRPKAGEWHRVLVGGGTGFVVAVIARGPLELYGLLLIVGAILGYIGFRWLKHVPF